MIDQSEMHRIVSCNVTEFLSYSPDFRQKLKVANTGTNSYVEKLALKSLDRGQILTTVMQFPQGFTPPLNKRLADEEPYNISRMGFRFRLKNVAKHKISVETGLKTIPVRKVKRTGIYADTDRWNSYPEYDVLAPGDEIEMGFHFAHMNLFRYCREAREPLYLDNFQGESRIVEVGYSFYLNGRMISSVDKKTWPDKASK